MFKILIPVRGARKFNPAKAANIFGSMPRPSVFMAAVLAPWPWSTRALPALAVGAGLKEYFESESLDPESLSLLESESLVSYFFL